MNSRSMSASLLSLLAGMLLMLGSPAALPSQTTWPVSPSRLLLPTPYGTLHVASNDYVYESRLQVDNTDVDPQVRGIINITYAFDMPTSRVALVSINTGNNGCPISYRWVVLEKSGYKMSPEFGSCNEQIKVTATRRLLTLQTPSTHTPNQIDVYVYDGKTVKHRATRKR